MLDQNVLHSVETEIEGMGEVRIRVGETDQWDAHGLMIELQWKDVNGNWTHGRTSVEFSVKAVGPIVNTLAECVRKAEIVDA